MPLYEYKCNQCGAVEEVIQKVSDKPLETCRKCGGIMHKVISSPAIQFKGSGWYVNDYAHKKPQTESHHKSKPTTEKTPKEKSPASEKATPPTPAVR